MYQIVEYERKPFFRQFGESVSAARRDGDADTDKTIIADTMKLLVISTYGKTVTNVDRHGNVRYCTEVGTSLLFNNKRFRQLDVVTDHALRSDSQQGAPNVRPSTTHRFLRIPLRQAPYAGHVVRLRRQVRRRRLQPFHSHPICNNSRAFYITVVKVNRANGMCCLDCRYVERPQFLYCEMDTDSAYIALAGDSVDDLVRPDRREHFFRHRSEWLPAECCDKHEYDYVHTRLAGLPWTAIEACCVARKAYDKRTPDLFKIEWRGDGFIGLCSKTYYCFGATEKRSTKGLNKRRNDIDKDAFLAVLTNRRSGSGVNRGFRVHDSSVMKYVQERVALTYFNAKRKVLADGLSTASLDV